MGKQLGELTTEELGALRRGARPLVVLIGVGSVEPHGPHLPLSTDTIISEAAILRASEVLAERGFEPLAGPSIPYGVTDFAEGFPGAVSVSAGALAAYLRAVVDGYLANEVAHVCLVNNHLEPAHDQAVRAAVADLPKHKVSVACPLARRWARTLSDEFKSGACHAGRYETSIVMAAASESVRSGEANSLPALPISLSEGIKRGLDRFREMGMQRAYAGAPAEATAEEGRALIEKLATMVVTEVEEALGSPG
jgi:creatinine amidohydrolase